MTTTLVMPKAGMGTTEGTITTWLKAEGERVTQGEVVVEIETAKAIEEIEAPVTGVLSKILLAEGDTAEVHSEMAIFEEDL